MKVHNRVEDLVLATVDDIFKDLPQDGPVCTCSQCRLDVACYVLNRMSPEYVISSRGLAHMEADYHSNVQKIADVVTLANEGIDVVSKSLRPNFDHKGRTSFKQPQGPLYSFPIISGRLFDGLTFAPITGKKVILYRDGDLVEMVDANWQNPYELVDAFPGNFMFWPKPLKSQGDEVSRSFEFQIKLDDPDFSTFSHRIEIPLTSRPYWVNALAENLTHHLHDLHIFSDSSDDGLEP